MLICRKLQIFMLTVITFTGNTGKFSTNIVWTNIWKYQNIFNQSAVLHLNYGLYSGGAVATFPYPVVYPPDPE